MPGYEDQVVSRAIKALKNLLEIDQGIPKRAEPD